MTFSEGLRGMGTVTYAWLVSPARPYSRPCMYIHTCLYESLGMWKTCRPASICTWTHSYVHKDTCSQTYIHVYEHEHSHVVYFYTQTKSLRHRSWVSGLATHVATNSFGIWHLPIQEPQDWCVGGQVTWGSCEPLLI